MDETSPSRPAAREPVSLDEHLAAVMATVAPLPAVTLATAQVPHTAVLAADAPASLAVPQASVSAVDGFAVRAADLRTAADGAEDPGTGRGGAGRAVFDVVGDVPAGAAPQRVPAGAAVRVMTGGRVVEDQADELVVVPVEYTDAPRDHRLPRTVTVTGWPVRRANVRFRGEHLRPGDVAVAAGTPTGPGTLAAAVSAGVAQLRVHRRPRVRVITTGDEIGRQTAGTTAAGAAAAGAAAAGAVPDSNAPMLCGLLAATGAEVDLRHCPDSPAAVTAALDDAAAEVDLAVTAGGISAGAFDPVKAAGLKAVADGRAVADFYPVAMHPGKPQGCGTWSGLPVVCLPGNPVAAWVSAVLFALPAARRLAGAPAPSGVARLPHTVLTVDRTVATRHAGAAAAPARLDWAAGTARVPAVSGSHRTGTLAGADGLVLAVDGRVEAGAEALVLLAG